MASIVMKAVQARLPTREDVEETTMECAGKLGDGVGMGKAQVCRMTDRRSF